MKGIKRRMKRFNKLISIILSLALVMSVTGSVKVYADDTPESVYVEAQGEDNSEPEYVEHVEEADEPQQIIEEVPAEESAPVVEEISEEEPMVEEPEAEEPEAEEPAAEEPVVEEPIAEEFPKEKPTVEEPAIEETPVEEVEIQTPLEILPPVENSKFGSGISEISTLTESSGTYYSTMDPVDDGGELTVILKGLTEGNKVSSFNAINKYINRIFEEGRLPLEAPADLDQFIDAEKYNVYEFTYDANHCWAGTAANVLWMTGYAQKTVNPITGKYFTSEDEVMAYFSEHFTDEAGTPDEAVKWFLNGEYSCDDEEGVAHRKDKNSGGLFNIKDLDDRTFYDYVLGNPERIDALEYFQEYGIGVLVRWIINDKLTSFAHWMTVVGAIIDETTDNIYDRYKAIVIADSDSNPANGELPADYQTKLDAKKNRPNIYTVYRLYFDEKYGVWCMDYDVPYPTVITFFFSLFDIQPEDIVNSVVPNPDNPDELYVVVPNGTDAESVIMDINYFKSLTIEQLEIDLNIQMLRDYMKKNQMSVFAINEGTVNEGKDYVAYITSPETFVYGVSIDGEDVPFNQYSLENVNGLTKITIKNEYLAKLPKGKHSVLINIQGIDNPAQSDLMIE